MEYRKILVIKYGAIGDFIAGTILLTALRKACPQSHITLLSKESNRAICPPGTLVDDFWAVESIKTGKLGYWKLLRTIRQARFDLVINLRWTSEVLAVITALSGAGATAGISRNGLRKLYRYTVHDITDFDNRHEYLKNTDPLRALHIPFGFPEAFVAVSDADRQQAAAVIDADLAAPFMVFCPTASNPLKAWPPDRYIAFGRWIEKQYNTPILVSWAGSEEQKVAAAIAEGIGGKARLLPAISINVLAAIMQRAKLVVCNNSGSLHIAFAQKTPVICFNTSKGWEPYGPDNVALSVFHEEPGFNLVYTTNEMAAAQLATISVEDAISAFERKWPSLIPPAEGSAEKAEP